MTRPSDALADREVRERLPLRTGGTVALTDEHLLVVTSPPSEPSDGDEGDSDEADGNDGDGTGEADGEITRIALDDVAGVTVEEFDYLLGALSAVLVGWGVYAVRQNAALGLAFAAFGAFGFLWTFRKRGKVRIEVADRPKPISVFPEDADALANALEPVTAAGPGDSTRSGESAASDQSDE